MLKQIEVKMYLMRSQSRRWQSFICDASNWKLDPVTCMTCSQCRLLDYGNGVWVTGLIMILILL